MAARRDRPAAPTEAEGATIPPARMPTRSQARWLARGLDQPGGKLPLFDRAGKPVGPSLVAACLRAGWAERWFENPLKPDWLVCRLTPAGREALAATAESRQAAT